MPQSSGVLADSPTRFELLPCDWKTGEYGVPVARYISADFAALEAERFWPRVWQMACRVDQIPNPGDFTVYDLLNESIILVRVDESTVKAYHNVCPHRATALAVGTGHLQLKQIVCPFHGWRWNLDGSNRVVLNKDEFKPICQGNYDVDLKEVHARQWGGSIYICLDKQPVPFEQFVAPIATIVDAVKLAEMRFHYHYRAKVNCNWKVALEAFMEAYHVPQTHPQLTPGKAEDFTSLYHYEPMQNGHGLFHSAGAGSTGRISRERALSMSQEQQIEALFRSLQTLHIGQDAQAHSEELEIVRTLRHKKIPEGKTVGEYFQTVLREHYAAQGRPIASFESLSKVNQMFIFPHVIFLPTFGNAVMYRARPAPDNNPDECIFDMYAVRTYAEGHTPPPWNTVVAEGKLDDPNTWWLIPSQDFTSIVRQQRGMHSMAIKSTILSSRQESLISNMHRMLDDYLQN